MRRNGESRRDFSYNHQNSTTPDFGNLFCFGLVFSLRTLKPKKVKDTLIVVVVVFFGRGHLGKSGQLVSQLGWRMDQDR